MKIEIETIYDICGNLKGLHNDVSIIHYYTTTNLTFEDKLTQLSASFRQM